MIYLVSYDIESDKVRLKIAKKLLEYGLERIQYSVFLGVVKESMQQSLKNQLRDIFQQANLINDKLLMIPMTRGQLKKYTSFSNNIPDFDYLCGDTLVLIL